MPWWLILVVVIALVAAMGAVAWRLVASQTPEMRALLARVGRLRWRAKGRLAWALLRDRRVPLWTKALVAALGLYLAMPIDIIPDFIPVIGYLDDLVAAALVAGVLLRYAPREVVEEHLSRLEGAGDSAVSGTG